MEYKSKSHLETEEYLSASILHSLLNTHGYKVNWEAIKNDPPDFVFFVDKETWGVEHTRLVQYYKWKKKIYSEQEFNTIWMKYIGTFNKATEGRIRSSWSFTYKFPIDKNHLKNIGNKIVKAVNNDNPAELLDISDDDLIIQHKNISKPCHMRFAYMHKPHTRVPESNKISADIAANIKYSLRLLLKKKNSKLWNEGLLSIDKKVLLIQNTYFFADRTLDSLVKYAAKYNTAFNSIYLITDIGRKDIKLIYPV